jgi:hypothetical protein
MLRGVAIAVVCGVAVGSEFRPLSRDPFNSDWVQTPGGLMHRDCVHEVPSGTASTPHPRREGHAILKFPNGTIRTFPPCMHQAPPGNAVQESGLQVAANASSGGSHAYPMNIWGGEIRSGIQRFSANIWVPEPPRATGWGTTLYWWIGTYPPYGYRPWLVLQPVLAYREGQGWYAQSWNCCPAGHKFHTPGQISVQPNQQLPSEIVATGYETYLIRTCLGGQCEDLSASGVGLQSVPTITMETWGAASGCTPHCSYMPGSALIMTDISISPGTTWAQPSDQCWSVNTCGWQSYWSSTPGEFAIVPPRTALVV